MNRASTKPPLILIVDDEPTMLRYLRTLLEVEGYRVETATNGAEAMQRLQQTPTPELLLLDVLMPVMDGLQTLEQVRQLHPQLKVVMLSCVSDTRKVVHAIRLGAQDYLTKPFQKADLDAVIEQCIGDRKEHAVNHAHGEIEDLGDDVFFVAASPVMRKI